MSDHGTAYGAIRGAEAGREENAELRMHGERWEHGSFFPLTHESGRATFPWSGRPHSLWGSGRDALRALLREKATDDGWQRLLVPSYFCQDVLASLAQEIEIRAYPCGPLSQAVAVQADRNEVVLSVALFGSRPNLLVDEGTTVIEDHSHDTTSVWAEESDADYAVASLRKTYPLPDGGVVWSPKGHPVPEEIRPTEEHDVAAFAQLSAMALKRQYLEGGDLSKTTYLELYATGERAISGGSLSGISEYSRARLPTLPTLAWSRVRSRNRHSFREALGEIPDVHMLDVPFAVVLLFESREARDSARMALIAARVFPSVLWPLENTVVHGVTDEDRSLSSRFLSIHCDQRYDEADMERAAEEVQRAINDH